MIQLDILLYCKVGHICPLSRSRKAVSDKAMLGCLTGWWGRLQAESSAITQRHGDRPYGDGGVAGRVLWMIMTSHTSLMWCNGPWEVSCLGKNTHSSTKWSNHVLEAMWVLRVPGGGSKEKKRPPRPWEKAEHWPKSHWSACSGKKQKTLSTITVLQASLLVPKNIEIL